MKQMLNGEVERFLGEIDFDNRLRDNEWFSSEELWSAVALAISKTEQKKMSTGALSLLCRILFEEAETQMKVDTQLLGVLCDLADRKTLTPRMLDAHKKTLQKHTTR
ncbi:hypothetical protein AB0D62_28510 [Streptomyces massasporeus]|uniref:hypothetical protein n=1 Tax=Streptomyces massasporeus TaxID=67324 RepID=UPI0033CD6D14